MIIKHINNSFFEITSERRFKLICDPWIGGMKDTGTWSYPNLSSNKNILNKLKPDLVYISHLHSDHYDENIIKNLKNKKTKFIVKKFRDQRLKNKIESLGIKNVIELQEWEPFKFKNFEITIIPCDESNNQEIDTFINYDLDTSILIYDKKSKTCFYNNVDNPCSLNILKKLKNISKKRYKKIDIASFAPRPASEYPQNFINLTNKQKNKFKNLIIKRTLNNAFDKCNKLSIKNYIPAGGNFILYGKYHKMQKYVAHPSIAEMDNFFIKKKKLNYFNIDNCGYVEMRNGKVINFFKPENNEKTFLLPHRLIKKKYEYEKININSNLDKKFISAKNNYLKMCERLNIKNSWKINIFLYKNLKIDKNLKILDKKKYSKHYKVSWSKKKINPYNLDLYLDLKLFYKLITNKHNWNMAIGGGLIMFERNPNLFRYTFSAQFFKVIK